MRTARHGASLLAFLRPILTLFDLLERVSYIVEPIHPLMLTTATFGLPNTLAHIELLINN